MKMPRFTSTLALGAAVVVLSVGGAFAAVTVDTAVNVMAGPGQNFKTIARLDANTNVRLVAQSKDWCRVSAVDAKGWIPCANLSGLPGARINAAPKASTNYDFQSDPYFGPTVAGGNHTVYNGEFH
jgi:uncharacterized protein YgiM (DUF1202 family)